MKKVRILTLMVFLFVCTVPLGFADKESKIGYVDLSHLFDDYYKTKEYDKVLEAKNSDFEKESNAKLDKIREAQSKLSLLKEQEKAKLEEDIEKMKNELLEYNKQKKTDLTKERNEKIREILLEIEKVVSDYAQKQKYDIILNDRVLIYGDKSYDLTDQILKILNENKPADKPADNKK